MAKPTGRAMREELLDVAQELAQTRGVTEFSYADLAERVGIRSASIHHHFAKKEDLLAEIARRYRSRFNADLRELEERSTQTQQLEGYRDLFAAAAVEGKLCLCGAAAAEWSAIGDATKQEVLSFFTEQRHWLRTVISRGIDANEFAADLDPEKEADLVLSSLEGALLLARVEQDQPNSHIDLVFERLLSFLAVQP